MKDEQNDMKLPVERVAWLIAGYLRQTLSEKEHDELDEWMVASDENQELFEELTDPTNIEKGLKEYEGPDAAAALERIKTKIKFTRPAKKTPQRDKRIIAYGIAASILLIAGIFIVSINVR